MKMSKLIKTFESFLTWDKKEIKENYKEINELIDKLHEKENDIKKKIKKAENTEENVKRIEQYNTEYSKFKEYEKYIDSLRNNITLSV